MNRSNIIGIIGLAFVLAALERAVVPVALVLPLIIGYSIFAPLERAFLVALVTGLIEDLMMVRTLGISSAVFLVVVLVLGSYGRRFSTLNWLWLLVFSILASFGYWQVIEGRWLVVRGVVEAGLVVVWWLVVMGRGGSSDGVYLRLEE